jgi:hypothetical protein
MIADGGTLPLLKLNYFDTQHRQLATDPHVPCDQGTNWSGLRRVPPGQTYSRNPITGAQLAYNSANPLGRPLI